MATNFQMQMEALHVSNPCGLGGRPGVLRKAPLNHVPSVTPARATNKLLVRLDRSGRIVAANSAFRSLHDALPRSGDLKLVGTLFWHVPFVRPIACEANGFLESLKRVTGGTMTHFRCVYRSQGAEKETWYALEAHAGRSRGALVSMDDIGPWILASRGLDPVRAAGILEIERKRIAADLHDSTSQHLSAIGLHLMALQRHGHFEGKSLAIVTEIQRSLEAAQKELRSISYVMYPLDLQREGFVSTLRRFSEGFSCRTGMDTNLQIEPCADGLPLDVQGALLRIIQEAMANAYRHSGAARLVVHVAIKRGAAIACVIDDGRGMPRENRQIKPTTGVGIAAMAARAERLGGHLRIRSAPGGGTRVSALVPVMTGPPQIVRLSGPIYRGTPSRI